MPDHRPILEAARLLRNRGVFLEATNLVIPGHNDKEKQIRNLAGWVRENLGPDTPLHFSRYYPCYKMEAPPTPVETLERAWDIARKTGLNFVYAGNVPGHNRESTLCPGCGEIVIKRTVYQIEFMGRGARQGKCPGCGRKIPLAGKKWMAKL